MTGSNGSQNRDARKKTCLLQWYRQILNYLGIFTPIGDDRYASYFHLNAEYISTYFSLSHGCAAICITFNRCPGSSTTSSLLSKSLTLWEIWCIPQESNISLSRPLAIIRKRGSASSGLSKGGTPVTMMKSITPVDQMSALNPLNGTWLR